MDLSFIKNRDSLILLIPALIIFSIALIPTIKYQWPLSGDVFYHVHIAKLYIEHGLTYWDSLTSAPFGRPIFYPPLFHLSVASLTLLFKTDPYNVVRALQPILAMLIILSFSYVAYKLYNLFLGFSIGFYIMFSVAFQRFMLPIPENIALILFPFAVYYFYKSVEHSNYKYALISGFLAGNILLIHGLSAICLFLVIITFSIAIRILRKKSIGHFFTVFSCIALIIAAIWWVPLLIKYGIPFRNIDAYYMGILDYPRLFGTIPLIFAFIGGISMLKKEKT